MLNFNASTQKQIHLHFMALAIKQAHLAFEQGEVPVGALIIKNNEIISSAYNLKETGPSSTYHAEIMAIEKASKALNTWRLSDCTLYVTLEPCVMCAGALIASRIGHLVYGTPDPKGGAINSIFSLANHEQLNHKFKVTQDVLQSEASKLLKDFFSKRRSK